MATARRTALRWLAGAGAGAVPAGARPAAAAATAPAAPAFVPLAVGPRVWTMNVLVTLVARAAQTGGAYATFTDDVLPGAGPPLHVHAREDETWYMLDGELDWTVGGETFRARTGDFVHLPREVPHRFENRSGRIARMFLSYVPGGFEEWFLEVGEPAGDGALPSPPPPPAPPERLEAAAAAAARYGVRFLRG